MSKTIEIKKIHIRNLFLSFILGFGILYGLEHFGSFSYDYDYSPEYSEKPSLENKIPSSTKVTAIRYKTYFDDFVSTGGNNFNLYDMNYSDTEFKRYSTKSYYYTQATIVDFKYGIYISLGLFITTLFFTNFKIKLT